VNAIDWRRARANGRVVKHKIERGLSLLGLCWMAYFGAALAPVPIFDLAWPDTLLLHLAKGLGDEVTPAEAMQTGAMLVVPLVIGGGLLVWSLGKIVQWFRHTGKRI
jgi:hypothetical protein